MNETARPWYHVAMTLIGLVIAIYVLFPIFWLVLASFKPDAEMSQLPISFWPVNPTLEAYTDLFTTGTQSSQLLNWPTLITNSFIIAVSSTILVVVLATFAGYAFSRLKFPGRDLILGGLLISRMFQGAALLLPTYRLMNTLGLQDSLIGLILLYSAFGLPFATWIIASSLREIPVELEESAMIDGASRFERLRYVIIPHLMPLIVFVTLIHLMDSYRVFEEVVAFNAQSQRISLQWLTYDFLQPDDSGTRAIGRASASSMLTLIGIVIILIPVLRQTWRSHKT